MESKRKWNLSVFRSVAGAFDDLLAGAYRGEKGTACSAAVLMFLVAPASARQRFIDIIKLAEGRGLDGSVLDAARAEFARQRDARQKPARAKRTTAEDDEAEAERLLTGRKPRKAGRRRA